MSRYSKISEDVNLHTASVAGKNILTCGAELSYICAGDVVEDGTMNPGFFWGYVGLDGSDLCCNFLRGLSTD